MPIATPETYVEMLDRARDGRFAYPAINVTSSQTVIAALTGFAEAESDGILQLSVGAGQYVSGPKVHDTVVGCVALAEFIRSVAAHYDVTVAVHTDHCSHDHLDDFMRPLMAVSRDRVKAGGEPLFHSYMWDGSALPVEGNLEIAAELLEQCAEARALLEIEVGVVGTHEDAGSGHGNGNGKLYTTIEDSNRIVEVLGTGERGRYLTALTFGNVHGAYQPGAVVLRPELLGEIQDAIGAQVGRERPFDLVFHGGSGSTEEEIRIAVANGVIKMNIDTDTQYAFTRPVVDHLFQNYEKVLKVDGKVGDKKAYDPRVWGRAGEAGMAARVASACATLGSTRTSMSRLPAM